MQLSRDLAVQSYCFRGFKDNAKTAGLVKDLGLNKIELCAVHADFKTPAAFRDIVRIYRDAGVEVVSLGVNMMNGDEAVERNLFECLKVAGAKHMSVTFGVQTVPQSYRVAEKLAEEYDVRLGIHNHGGRHWLGCAEMLAQVFRDTSPRVGLCLDTAWALHSHEDPLAMAEKFAGRLFALHLKDFTFDHAGKHQDVVVGTGNLDLGRLNALLKKIGYNGCTVLEYEGDVSNPVPALTECVKQIAAAMV